METKYRKFKIYYPWTGEFDTQLVEVLPGEVVVEAIIREGDAVWGWQLVSEITEYSEEERKEALESLRELELEAGTVRVSRLRGENES